MAAGWPPVNVTLMEATAPPGAPPAARPASPARLVVLVSGEGTNLQALIDAAGMLKERFEQELAELRQEAD